MQHRFRKRYDQGHKKCGAILSDSPAAVRPFRVIS